MKVSTKLILLVSTALAGVICIAAIALSQLNSSLIESRQGQVQTLLTKAEHLTLS